MDNLPKIIKRYRKKKFPFNISDNLKCVQCKLILLNATQTSCGCRYCRECIETYLEKGSKKCLGSLDCDEIENIITDNAVNKEIGKLIVRCLFDECTHEAMLKDIGEHLDMCEYQTIQCPLCQRECIKNQLDKHLKDECKMRLVICPHCESSMTFVILQEIHLNVFKDELCTKFEDICPHKCGTTKKVNIVNHRKECKNKPILCPFSYIKCTDVVTKENIEDHLVKQSYNHSTKLIQELINLRQKNVELILITQNLEKDFKDIKTEFNNHKRELEKKNSETKHLPSNPSSATNIVSNNNEKTIYRNGIYIWKIERFNELKTSADRGDRIAITSDAFYTKEFGYKMSMKIYPAGDGVGKGTHLSVFFTLMKGEFDDILSWPFKNKVTLTILDQKNKTTDHSDTFKPDPRSTCYQQPIDDYNIASGSPKFIPFTQLSEYYIKNNTIYLKIQILN